MIGAIEETVSRFKHRRARARRSARTEARPQDKRAGRSG